MLSPQLQHLVVVPICCRRRQPRPGDRVCNVRSKCYTPAAAPGGGANPLPVPAAQAGGQSLQRAEQMLFPRLQHLVVVPIRSRRPPPRPGDRVSNYSDIFRAGSGDC